MLCSLIVRGHLPPAPLRQGLLHRLFLLLRMLPLSSLMKGSWKGIIVYPPYRVQLPHGAAVVDWYSTVQTAYVQ